MFHILYQVRYEAFFRLAANRCEVSSIFLTKLLGIGPGGFLLQQVAEAVSVGPAFRTFTCSEEILYDTLLHQRLIITRYLLSYITVAKLGSVFS